MPLLRNSSSTKAQERRRKVITTRDDLLLLPADQLRFSVSKERHRHDMIKLDTRTQWVMSRATATRRRLRMTSGDRNSTISSRFGRLPVVFTHRCVVSQGWRAHVPVPNRMNNMAPGYRPGALVLHPAWSDGLSASDFGPPCPTSQVRQGERHSLADSCNSDTGVEDVEDDSLVLRASRLREASG